MGRSLVRAAGRVLTVSVKGLTELWPALINARALETPSLSFACVGIHGG